MGPNWGGEMGPIGLSGPSMGVLESEPWSRVGPNWGGDIGLMDVD